MPRQHEASDMPQTATPVLTLQQSDHDRIADLLGRFGLRLEHVQPDASIPGSFWGEEEAGLLGDRLLARSDTPIHSILHETCHFICMDPKRRKRLDTNAGGDYEEENGVCYLQILLADFLPDMGRDRMMADMDAWGYSFRLGSARAWFENDAGDAKAWLMKSGLIDQDENIRWAVRES